MIVAAMAILAGSVWFAHHMPQCEDAAIKPMQLKQKWLRSGDVVKNLASYSPTVAAFVTSHRQAILSEHVTWATKYEGKWDSDPKDDNAVWGTFEVKWNEKAIVFDKLQFHNLQTLEPDRLIIEADGTWIMFKDGSLFASGTWQV